MTEEIKELFEKNNIKFKESKSLKNKFIIAVEGDANDADYITETYYLSEENFFKNLESLRYIIENDVGSGDWEKNMPEDDALADQVRSFLPYGEYGVHTICGVNIIYHDENGVGYEIKL